jgi:hypothetical protein
LPRARTAWFSVAHPRGRKEHASRTISTVVNPLAQTTVSPRDLNHPGESSQQVVRSSGSREICIPYDGGREALLPRRMSWGPGLVCYQINGINL